MMFPLVRELAVDGIPVTVTPLAEIPQGCSSKFPTLGRSNSRQVLPS